MAISKNKASKWDDEYGEPSPLRPKAIQRQPLMRLRHWNGNAKIESHILWFKDLFDTSRPAICLGMNYLSHLKIKFQEQIKERSIKNIKSVTEVPGAREERSIKKRVGSSKGKLRA